MVKPTPSTNIYQLRECPAPSTSSPHAGYGPSMKTTFNPYNFCTHVSNKTYFGASEPPCNRQTKQKASRTFMGIIIVHGTQITA